MSLRNEGLRYGSIALLLHWSAAFCVLFAWTLGTLIDAFPKSWEAEVLFAHMSFGLVVLALLLGRLGWRMASPPPPPLATPLDPWGNVAALAVHVLLYALLLMVPWWGSASGSHAGNRCRCSASTKSRHPGCATARWQPR